MIEPKRIPGELDLPRRYQYWRTDQEQAVEDIVQSGKKFYLLDGPTGSGKSLTSIAAYKRLTVPDIVMSRMTDDNQKFRCVYLTRTMQLQDQLAEDFGAVRIKGRRNYPCSARRELTAEDCPGNLPCNYCEYKSAKSAAVRASLAVLNDAYYLTEVNGPGQFTSANMVVLDEVDSLENQLMEHIKFTVSERQCKKHGLGPPKNMESLSDWQHWAEQSAQQVRLAIDLAHKQLPLDFETWTDIEIEGNKEVKRSENFLNQMRIFINEVNESWILDLENRKTGWQVTFKPVTVAPYCERYLWRHGKRFLGMSGTILDPEILAADLGIKEYDYKRLDSHFPVQNRWLHYRPVVNLKHANMDTELPKLTEAVADAIKVNLPENILVHTVSNQIRDHLAQFLPLHNISPDILMTHDTANRAEKLEEFQHTRGKVMISPSFDRGVNLEDDQCRCVIICKVPYLNLGDKQVQARLKMPHGQRWYNLRAIQSVMQMTGRAVRSSTDWSNNIILDKQFDLLLARTRPLLPKWWLDAIRREE